MWGAPGEVEDVRYVVDAALCCAHGQCYSIAPDAFSANDDGENGRIGMEVDVPLASGHRSGGAPTAVRAPPSRSSTDPWTPTLTAMQHKRIVRKTEPYFEKKEYS